MPRVIITDKLKSYGAAKRELLPGVEHRQHARIEQPGGTFAPTFTPAREENAQVQIGPHRLNAFSPLITLISGHFQPRRHVLSAEEYRVTLQGRFQTWNEITGVKLVG